MSARTPAEALAAAVALLVDGPDTVGTLNTLAQACASTIEGSAVGFLVADPPPAEFALDLLAASSHRAAELELYLVQAGSGPCYDAITDDVDVSVGDEEALDRRWPDLAAVLEAGGFDGAHAWPMRWHGTAFGALNVFTAGHELTPDERSLGRGFADVAAAAIAYADQPRGIAEVVHAVRSTIGDRAGVEQAKGVLRHMLGADEEVAFEMLTDRARATGASVTSVAREVLVAAEGGRRPEWLTVRS